MALGGGTASHMDFKLVGKPQTFSGSESNWIEWSFQMKAYIVMAQMYNAAELSVIENRTQEVDVSTMTGDNKKNSESLYYLLCLTCKGAAQTVSRLTPPGNGPEAWRQPHLRYGKMDTDVSMSMLQGSSRFHA